ncbi:MAG: NUDIX hydrolase [Gemmatimonadales bacterium]
MTGPPLRERLAHALAARPPLQVDEPGRRLAAVAVIAVPDPDSVLLIRRSERLGDPWSGHLGLPGGGFDPGDVDLLGTAVRETREEVGLDLAGAPCVGSLDDVAPRTPVLPPITVRPFVFCLDARPALTLSDEVARAFWIELAHLARPGIYQERVLEISGLPRSVMGYGLEDGLVWGMTERILTPLLTSLNQT